MKLSVLIAIIFCFSFLFGANAQDTNAPAMMSQHAYDSTLRALKKAAEAKHVDTVKFITPAIVKDSSEHTTPLLPDTIQRQEAKKEVAAKAEAEKKDTNKKKKIRYSPTGYLALSYGEGYPAGDFSKNAYPTKGGVASFTGAFPGIVSHFGIIFKIDYGFNRLDKVRYLDSLKSKSGDPNLGFTMDDVAIRYTYKTAMMGLFYTYPLKKISIDARILFGVMIATIPSTNVNIYDYSRQSTLIQVSYKVAGSAFALDEGISVRYYVLPLFCVGLSMDNLSASPSFTTASSGITPNPYGVEVQTQVKTNIYSVISFVSALALAPRIPLAPKGSIVRPE